MLLSTNSSVRQGALVAVEATGPALAALQHRTGNPHPFLTRFQLFGGADPANPVPACQWLPWPSGSTAAQKGKPLMVPAIIDMPRVGSFALALSGNVTTSGEPNPTDASARDNFASKRMAGVVPCSLVFPMV